MQTMKVIIFLISALYTCETNGQIYFKNMNPEPVYVAFAHFTPDKSGGQWKTSGWWTVNSGSTHFAFPSIEEGDSIGYWCMTTLSTDTYEGTRRLLVVPEEKFTIINAGRINAGESHPTWEWYKFRVIGINPGMTPGTITFRD